MKIKDEERMAMENSMFRDAPGVVNRIVYALLIKTGNARTRLEGDF